MLAIVVAVCFAAGWLLRLGWIADYFSRPVLIGYIHGVAVVLVIGQLGKLLGLSTTRRIPSLSSGRPSQRSAAPAARRSRSARCRSRRCSASGS
jgi:hypothetical protein